MLAFLAQINEAMSGIAPFAQVGFGGALLVVVVRWLGRVETGLTNVEHAIRGLSKAIWMDLAERSAAGSFVREEAKRMVERDRRRDQAEADAAKARPRN